MCDKICHLKNKGKKIDYATVEKIPVSTYIYHLKLLYKVVHL